MKRMANVSFCFGHSARMSFLVVVQSLSHVRPHWSMPGFPIIHYLLEFAQTQVHWVDSAIQPSHPLLPASPPASVSPSTGSFPVSQLFPSGGQNIGASASALPVNIQDWFPLGLTGWISLEFKGRVFNITVQKHQFFCAQPSLWSNSHIHTWLLKKP